MNLRSSRIRKNIAAVSTGAALTACVFLAGCGSASDAETTQHEEVTDLEKEASQYIKDPWERRLLAEQSAKVARQVTDPWEKRLIAAHQAKQAQQAKRVERIVDPWERRYLEANR